MTDISTAPTALTASLNLSGVNVTTNVSGQVVVTNVSGQVIVAEISGQPISSNVSGNTVVIGASGQTLTLPFTSNASDTRTAQTTPLVQAWLYANDNGPTTWSRLRVTASGQGVSGVNQRLVVAFSGDSIKDYGSSFITAANVIATSASGGLELGSGVVIGAKVRAHNANSGTIFLGGVGADAPFSGKGLILAAADPPTDIKVSNFNALRVFASASGDRVSVAGIV